MTAEQPLVHARPDVAAQAVAAAILRSRYRFRSEADLQASIAETLTEHKVDADREVRLSDEDRIDFMVGRIGVEIKIDGTARTVLRQLRRYAASDQVDALVLVTNRATHLRLPEQIDGKPLLVRFIGGQGL